MFSVHLEMFLKCVFRANSHLTLVAQVRQYSTQTACKLTVQSVSSKKMLSYFHLTSLMLFTSLNISSQIGFVSVKREEKVWPRYNEMFLFEGGFPLC